MLYTKYKLSPFNAGLLAFIFSFVFFITLFSYQFFQHYKEYIIDKNVDLVSLKLLIFTVIGFSAFMLPLCVSAFSLVYYRQLFQTRLLNLNALIRKALLPLIVFCFFGFILTSFIVPKASQNQVYLLQNRANRATGPDIAVIVNPIISSNFFELQELIDSSAKDIINIKINAMDFILKFSDSLDFDKLKSDSIFNQLRISNPDFDDKFNRTKIKKNKTTTNLQFEKTIQTILTDVKGRVEYKKELIWRCYSERFKMIALPITIFITFFIGMFLGILINDQKYFTLLLFAIYALMLPIIYFIKSWFDNLEKLQEIGPFQGQLYFILLLVTIAILLYWYASSVLKNQTIKDVL